jgi:hypothetical protein
MQNETGTFDPDAFSQEFEPAKFSGFSTESVDSGHAAEALRLALE